MPKPYRLFRLRFITDGDTGGSKPEGEQKKPTSEMTPEERIEFEQGAKRKAQDRLKAFDGTTPEDVATMRQKLDQLEKEKLTEQERAVADARDEARAEAFASSASHTVDAVLQVALRGRSADAATLLALDRSTFVVDGKADTAAIEKWVEENSTAGSSADQGRRHVDLGQGDRERQTVSGRATGEAEAQKRFGKKN